MAVNTYASLTNEQQTFYDRTLLKRLSPNTVWMKFAQKRPIPKGSGRTINFRKFESLPVATTPLTEGVTPTGSTMVVNKIEAPLKQYGDYIEESDILIRDGIDPILTENSAVLGEQAGLTLDTLTRDEVSNGTNVLFAGGKTGFNNITASDKLTSAEIKLAVKALKKANAKPAEGAFYVGIIDPDTSMDLQNDAEFKDVSKYNGGEQIMAGEVGKLHGVRFIETTNTVVKANTGSVNVHSTMILGADAYGAVDIDNSARKPSIIVKPVGSSGSNDPLNQRGTQGWKADYTAVRLNELAMIRIEHAVTE